jgi:hypothetical protein
MVMMVMIIMVIMLINDDVIFSHQHWRDLLNIHKGALK